MILADKIIRLRKKFGWSQEELAEKMNVSRQSVSKWESANSVPDLNKILLLSEIFGVSTDFLVKDEIEEFTEIREDSEAGVTVITVEEATNYVELKTMLSRSTAKGVLMCIYSVIPLLFLLGVSSYGKMNLNSNVAAAVGMILLFGMITVGVLYFLRINQYQYDFDKIEDENFELGYGVKSIFKEKVQKLKPLYMKRVSISVALFITSIIPLLVVSFLISSGMLIIMMVVLMLLMIGLGTYLMIPVSAHYNALNLVISEGDFTPNRRKANKKIAKLGTFYWPLITAVYIGWSLWTMAWGTTWIIWPVAGIGFASFIGLIGLFDRNEL